jgi:hypothetical protein
MADRLAKAITHVDNSISEAHHIGRAGRHWTTSQVIDLLLDLRFELMMIWDVDDIEIRLYEARKQR